MADGTKGLFKRIGYGLHISPDGDYYEDDSAMEYHIPKLSLRPIIMTRELARRREEESLRAKYGLCKEKEGELN